MHQIWIVDFGSQYTQLITRKTRELGFRSEILTVDEASDRLKKDDWPSALVLSGGPQSVFEDNTDFSLFFKRPELPILGICYGMQIMAHVLGGQVARGHLGEYGNARVTFEKDQVLNGFPSSFSVWMSHFDHVTGLPSNFEVVLKSDNGLLAMMRDKKLPRVGLQFHPEVEHTQHGKDLLRFFYHEIAHLREDWSPKAMLFEGIQLITQAKATNVLCAFSGGVDSLVAATLAHRVLGERLYCFFVDHGLLRPQDYAHIEILQKHTSLSIEIIDAKTIFAERTRGLADPEDKRKAIGKTFIEVFETQVHHFEKTHDIHFTHLLQGTLYPDVIESTGPHQKGGKSAVIKSHHNVGGLPERMKLKLLEPLRFLFKDEVRALGLELGLKPQWVYRHPFPGPGIGIRVLGELNDKAIQKVQQSDQILFEELQNFHLYQAIWQAFTVLLPIRTVGVKGDARAYEEVIAVRLVNSSDGMTAHWSDVPRNFLETVSSRITNEVLGITRVVYDITSKPPGTIEWE
ncbi:MAG: glutamine-hydrolyzing GMP synthase [Bdellovibrio sp.]|nr:glutamine-hydrolyzing GMP synthase [Bdellovibrio sp.]